MVSYKYIPEALGQQFSETMWALNGDYKLPEWLLNRPTTPQPITREERVQGLAAVWAEAKCSFAYWDRLPGLDWDVAFREYLPRVEAADEPNVYYGLLREFVHLLDEGHSYVMPPEWLREQQVPPPLGLAYVEGEPVVVRGELLPPGTVITSIEGQTAQECLSREAKRVSPGTQQNRMAKACGRLLLGEKDSTVTVAVRRPGGVTETVRLTRSGALAARSAFERHDLGQGRVLIRINTWVDEAVVQQFHDAFPDFAGVTGLIIDQRYNGGGNSGNGNQIFARLIAEPVPPYSTSAVPLYWGAMGFAGLQHLMLATSAEPLLPDESRPRFAGPVAVLTGPATFSAAEDFCMLARSSGRVTLVGETTGGSTGNPAIVQLPGGGIAFVSATQVRFPDGTQLSGVGVVPDIPVAPTIAGIAAGRDEVLERALDVLAAAGA